MEVAPLSTRRLRTSDGIYFTKFGARKLALYVEREIERSLSSISAKIMRNWREGDPSSTGVALGFRQQF